jgi:hypothetical protein
MASMNQVWDDCIAFIKRERALLVPLAMATLVLGNAVADLAANAAADGAHHMKLTVLAAILWVGLGQMAIATLVLRPGTSVGEAIRHALKRVPTMLLISLCFGLIGALLVSPVLLILMKSGVDLTAARPKIPPSAAVLILALTGLAIWITVRLTTLTPTVLDQRQGLVAMVKSAWAMTKGFTLALLGVLGLYLIVSLVLTRATEAVFGTVFFLGTKMIGSPFLGNVLTSLVVGLVSGLCTLIASVFVAILYRHLSAGSSKTI